MGIDVRPATREDTDGIQHVAERAWHSAHAPIIGAETTDEFLERYYDAATFRSLFEDDDSILGVAVEDGKTGKEKTEAAVVGFVGASPTDGDSATFDLGRIYVLPSRWREGIGDRLLSHAERTVADRGGERIRLGVMAENERAIEFYESAGYRRDEKFYDERIDTSGYVYVKELS
ncbi:acetyltransferase [Haladaptatus sp. R4]|uniref:GNAT family N-acetyltransferase n=1 Tax=Haladaptatus sp. R4 TaxID=1679489 RepID=UPI0007B4BB08|nr:N-acetyltransferase [Haladaptatus sp. R4]KZN23882.1 acetyltransferase [Haladaptatus sp. R4]